MFAEVPSPRFVLCLLFCFVYGAGGGGGLVNFNTFFSTNSSQILKRNKTLLHWYVCRRFHLSFIGAGGGGVNKF